MGCLYSVVICRYPRTLVMAGILLVAAKSSALQLDLPDAPQSGASQSGSQQQQPPNTPSQSQPGAATPLAGAITKVESSVDAAVNRLTGLPGEWFLGTYVPSHQNLHSLTGQERRRVYVRQTYLTGASYLKRLFAAGVDQARGVPYAWGGGWEGYGRRFGSRYAQFVIQNSFTSAGDAVLHYEPRYDLCECTGFWPRSRHAIMRNFLTYNETEADRRAQIPLYIAAFGAGALASEWKPPGQTAWRNGVYAAAGQAGYGAISNWLQEFALDIGRKLPRRK
jgi:hypothetical protein